VTAAGYISVIRRRISIVESENRGGQVSIFDASVAGTLENRDLTPVRCPLCNARKPKRACPALDRQICAACCGTKRLTEINCPSTCTYLAASKTHPPAIAQRRQARDLGFLLPFLAELTEPQYRLLLFFQEITLRHSDSPLTPLRDEDVAEAAATVAATLETAGKGIIYQHQATSIPAQSLADAIEAAIGEVGSRAGGRYPSLESDAAVTLRQLARAASAAGDALTGDEAPVFLKLLRRIMTNPDAPAGSDPEPGLAGPDTATRLVIPG